MSIAALPERSPWGDAQLAAALFAVAPQALGGVSLRGYPGPVRDTWLELVRDLLPPDQPWRRVPLHISEGRLLGGLDLAATLRAGKPIAERGLLVECDGGVAVMAMAERASRSTLAHISAAMDTGEVLLERDGMEGRSPARFGVIALDEAVDEEDALSPVMQDRLALHLDLRPIAIRQLDDMPLTAADIAAARDTWATVSCDEETRAALCGAAMSLGVDSLRASLFAVTAARVHAALAGHSEVAADDLDAIVRLVLLPLATRMPAPPPDEAPPEESEQAEQPPEVPPETPAPEPPSGETPPEPPEDTDTDDSAESPQTLEDRILDAAMAAIPKDLLAQLAQNAEQRSRGGQLGKSGQMQKSFLRGRPMGVVPGNPRSGARLSLVATLRTAAPWQTLRRKEEGAIAGEGAVQVRRDDFRVMRFRQRSESTTIFVVDASGSAALHRLAEAKGAVELLLADCYTRRDQVALITFRGEQAEMLLPPTRSLVRAKRNLAALPGGGGTPLASALDATATLVDHLQRRGGTPNIVMLTDGRANIARDGARGRQQAFEDALAGAALIRQSGARGMVIDTSQRPHENAAALAKAMGALYLPLPHADAARLRDAVQLNAG